MQSPLMSSRNRNRQKCWLCCLKKNIFAKFEILMSDICFALFRFKFDCKMVIVAEEWRFKIFNLVFWNLRKKKHIRLHERDTFAYFLLPNRLFYCFNWNIFIKVLCTLWTILIQNNKKTRLTEGNVQMYIFHVIWCVFLRRFQKTRLKILNRHSSTTMTILRSNLNQNNAKQMSHIKIANFAKIFFWRQHN